MGKSLRKNVVAHKITTKQFMKKNPIKKKKAAAKSNKAPKRATAPKRLTKNQIKQLRNSPTLKRKLDRANKIFKSPEFKEFIKNNPIRKKSLKK
jgi:hypothetical protein